LKSAPRRENLRDYGWRPTIKTTCEKVQVYRCILSSNPEEYFRGFRNEIATHISMHLRCYFGSTVII
jgi:hypothetical protein